MDNLTHSLVGWALGQTGLKTRTRKALPALILGANMPDIDVFFGAVPWEPLATHRGFTHGVVGVLVMPPILAAALWLLDRWQAKRGARFESGPAMHFGWLLALCYVATFTHPLLDWQTTYSVQLLSPFSELWFHNDALFIIDVWILLGLATALWLSRRREKAAGNWPAPTRAALALVVVYIGANSLVSTVAKDTVRAALSDAPETIYASPLPVQFWRRELAWQGGGSVAWGAYDPFAKPPGLRDHTEPVPDRMADPLVRLALRGVPTFARWSTMPFAQIERGRCRVIVTIADARYGRSIAGSRFRRRVTMPTGAPGC